MTRSDAGGVNDIRAGDHVRILSRTVHHDPPAAYTVTYEAERVVAPNPVLHMIVYIALVAVFVLLVLGVSAVLS